MCNMYIQSDAVFGGSKNQYRYQLKRIWDKHKEIVVYILLNPSTADKNTDDNTIRKCVKLAMHNGFGGMLIVNLFAFRATDPKDLLQHANIEDIIGNENNNYILQSIKEAGKIVLGWGNNVKKFKDINNSVRCKEIINLIKANGFNMYCIGRTNKDYPKHPLFIAEETDFIDF